MLQKGIAYNADRGQHRDRTTPEGDADKPPAGYTMTDFVADLASQDE